MSVPDDDKILAFLKKYETPMSAKDICHRMRMGKKSLGALKHTLRRLEQDGQIAFLSEGRYGLPGAQNKQHRTPAPAPVNDNRAAAPRPAKRVNLVGIVTARRDGVLEVTPCNKDDRRPFGILTGKDAKVGDVVVAEPAIGQRGTQKVNVTKVLGRAEDPGMFSLISLHEQGLRTEFSAAALTQARDPQLLTVPAPDATRVDLRNIPLVTIDGADSRDFDDAVYAEALPNGGHRLVVAIADVAHYVRPGDALDRDAYARGNSTYFPDRVLPMLPEELSNGVCSLNPGVDRACLAFDMTVDRDGVLQTFRLQRGVMKSAARLTYEQVQAAQDGNPDAVTAPLLDNVIHPLYAAYEMLAKARVARGTLDLDQAESKVKLSVSQGQTKIDTISKYERLDSHKVIEEFMILANVAAAKSLEQKEAPCVYREHEPPQSARKLESLAEYVQAFGINVPGAIEDRSVLRTILEEAKKKSYGALVAEAILRTQSKARYSPVNMGHFGLALDSYAHFTSPIRRYSDLLVHRLLIDAFNLGAGGISDAQRDHLETESDYISETERRSDLAERGARERYATSFLAASTGKTFKGSISSVTNSGLFIRLEGTGVSGLLPMHLLPADDTYECRPERHAVIGQRTGRVYRTGAASR